MKKQYKFTQDSEAMIEIKTDLGFIYLDRTDVELPLKVENMMKSFDNNRKMLRQEEVIIDKKKLPEEQASREKLNLMIKMIDSTYAAIDKLFGEGSTKLIFRSKSIKGLEMFFELINELMEDYALNTQEIYDNMLKDIENKYQPLQADTSDIEDVE